MSRRIQEIIGENYSKMGRSDIEWLARPGTIPESWNFIAGCTKRSRGCENCYALRMAWRMQSNPKAAKRYEGVCEKINGHLMWTGQINVDEEALRAPDRWRDPRTVFTCSMADVFHRKVPDTMIARAFATMAHETDHTFHILTKRAYRMHTILRYHIPIFGQPHIIPMVSVEDEYTANERIPWLLRIPATHKGVSLEPLLGPVRLDRIAYHDDMTRNALFVHGDERYVDWIVIGPETGPGRRPCKPEWIRDIITQADVASRPVFVKALEVDGKISHDPMDWPEEFRRREFPA